MDDELDESTDTDSYESQITDDYIKQKAPLKDLFRTAIKGHFGNNGIEIHGGYYRFTVPDIDNIHNDDFKFFPDLMKFLTNLTKNKNNILYTEDNFYYNNDNLENWTIVERVYNNDVNKTYELIQITESNDTIFHAIINIARKSFKISKDNGYDYIKDYENYEVRYRISGTDVFNDYFRDSSSKINKIIGNADTVSKLKSFNILSEVPEYLSPVDEPAELELVSIGDVDDVIVKYDSDGNLKLISSDRPFAYITPIEDKVRLNLYNEKGSVCLVSSQTYELSKLNIIENTVVLTIYSDKNKLSYNVILPSTISYLINPDTPMRFDENTIPNIFKLFSDKLFVSTHSMKEHKRLAGLRYRENNMRKNQDGTIYSIDANGFKYINGNTPYLGLLSWTMYRSFFLDTYSIMNGRMVRQSKIRMVSYKHYEVKELLSTGNELYIKLSMRPDCYILITGVLKYLNLSLERDSIEHILNTFNNISFVSYNNRHRREENAKQKINRLLNGNIELIDDGIYNGDLKPEFRRKLARNQSYNFGHNREYFRVNPSGWSYTNDLHSKDGRQAHRY